VKSEKEEEKVTNNQPKMMLQSQPIKAEQFDHNNYHYDANLPAIDQLGYTSASADSTSVHKYWQNPAIADTNLPPSRVVSYQIGELGVFKFGCCRIYLLFSRNALRHK